MKKAAAAGAVGVHVGTSIAGRRLDEPEFDGFWAAAAAAGLPVEIHPDFTYDRHPALAPYYLSNVIGLPLETTIAIERLICAGVLDRHPDLRLVLLHGAGFFPYQAGRLRHARTVRPELADSPADPWGYAGQVVIDTITHDAAALEYLISRVGAENVVLGTDIPFDMAPADPVGLLRAGARDEPAVVEQVGASNAARVYNLDTAALASTIGRRRDRKRSRARGPNVRSPHTGKP
jgi:aminocarboxymuconate-semialdehyde decarboxylase